MITISLVVLFSLVGILGLYMSTKSKPKTAKQSRPPLPSSLPPSPPPPSPSYKSKTKSTKKSKHNDDDDDDIITAFSLGYVIEDLLDGVSDSLD